MNHCTRLSDRILLVARGKDDWSADEAHHLEICADCQADWRLVVSVRELADSAGRWEPELDTITAAALARVRSDRAGRGRALQLKGGAAGLAAAAVLIVAAVQFLPGTLKPEGGPDAVLATLPVPGLEALDESQLEELLQALNGPLLGDEADIDPPQLGALDSTGLATVLIRLEEP